VLAAGKGKRMKSGKSKVLRQLLDKSMIEYVVDALKIKEIERTAVIVGTHNSSEIKNILGNSVDYILQQEALGTAHAVMCAGPWLSGFEGNLVIAVGDAPLIDKETIRSLIKKFEQGAYTALLLSGVFDTPPAYGRIVRNEQGRILKVVEDKDTTAEEKKIKEVSSSHYCFNKPKLFSALRQVTNQNAQGEYYLPDVIEIFIKNEEKVEALTVDDPMITFGINDPEEFSEAVQILRKRQKK
jgi:bifunctional UDP-N-acetylglucosamine pyrophosphorylase/glucosamine-1-phosphate N-acetyltransferase